MPYNKYLTFEQNVELGNVPYTRRIKAYGHCNNITGGYPSGDVYSYINPNTGFYTYPFQSSTSLVFAYSSSSTSDTSKIFRAYLLDKDGKEIYDTAVGGSENNPFIEFTVNGRTKTNITIPSGFTNAYRVNGGFLRSGSASFQGHFFIYENSATVTNGTPDITEGSKVVGNIASPNQHGFSSSGDSGNVLQQAIYSTAVGRKLLIDKIVIGSLQSDTSTNNMQSRIRARLQIRDYSSSTNLFRNIGGEIIRVGGDTIVVPCNYLVPEKHDIRLQINLDYQVGTRINAGFEGTLF